MSDLSIQEYHIFYSGYCDSYLPTEECSYLVWKAVERGGVIPQYVCSTLEKAIEVKKQLEEIPLRSVADFPLYFFITPVRRIR